MRLDFACRAIDGSWVQRSPQNHQVAQGAGIDTRENLRGKMFFAIKGDRFDGHDFLAQAAQAGAVALVVGHKPRMALPDHIAVIQVPNPRRALGQLARAYRQSLIQTKVIAVVGSAGKTTTKRLIDAALQESLRGTVSPKSFNNDIGVPLTILNASLDHDYLVVEVGTNALGEIEHLAAIVNPDIAIITMIGREHLEGLHSLDHIAEENAAIIKHLRPDGLLIANADAELLRQYAEPWSDRILFGEAEDAQLRLTNRGSSELTGGAWWFEINHGPRFGLSLPGRHNAVNALAAVAVAQRLGVADERISAGLVKAQGAPMRMAIERVGGVTIYNDAYNANPESMTAALETFAEVAANDARRIIIIGDMLELGAAGPELHRELGKQIVALDQRIGIDVVIAVGELSAFAAAEIARSIHGDRVIPLTAIDSNTAAIMAKTIQPRDAILIKGSRGMGLERLIPAIESAANPQGSVRKLSSESKPKQAV